MPAENRDRDIIEHILRYCEQIETAHNDFNRSRERFDNSTTYQNAISMCILQIGELVGHLSDEFRDAVVTPQLRTFSGNSDRRLRGSEDHQ